MIYLVSNARETFKLFKLRSSMMTVESIDEEDFVNILKTDDIINMLDEDTRIDLYQKYLVKIPKRKWGEFTVDENDCIIIVTRDGNDFNFVAITF